MVLIAVPDVNVLARMYTDPELTLQDYWMVTKMLYGAQFDRWDFHNVRVWSSIVLCCVA
jgi:hypothetical protein